MANYEPPAHRPETGGYDGRARTLAEAIADIEFNSKGLAQSPVRRQNQELLGWLRELQELRSAVSDTVARLDEACDFVDDISWDVDDAVDELRKLLEKAKERP